MRWKYLYALMLFLFFLSGFSSLIYEVIWFKWFGYVFGVTVYAVTTVVAAFMAGLALGSFLFGKLIDQQKNPLRVYVLLELGVGLYAISFPWIVKNAYMLYVPLSNFLGFSLFMHNLGMFVFGFLLLLVPTAFMGGTLPVLIRFVATKQDSVGGDVGNFYAVNTFGAVAGVLLAAFLLIPSLGLVYSAYIAVLFNLLIAGVFSLINRFAVDRSKRDGVEKKLDAPLSKKPFDKSALCIILWVFGTSGFVSLAYEILWVRMLMPAYGINVYSFAKVLAVYLFGIGLGSLIYARWLDEIIEKPLFWFALVELGIGLGAVLSIILFNYFSAFGNYYLFTEYIIILVPTVFMGISFPLVNKALDKNIDLLGRSVGITYSVNTVGAIVGSFVAGFFLLKFFGIQTSIFILTVINFVLCLVILYVCRGIRKATRYVAMGIVVLIILLTPIMHNHFSQNVFRIGNWQGKQVYYKEGVTATVEILEYKTNVLSMRINGKTLGSDVKSDIETQSLLSHLPLLLHENPEEAFFVGLGTGMTAGVATLYPVKTIDVAEISPEVVEASELFSHINYNLSNDSRYNIIIDDARNYLLKTDKKYDVISAEPMDPYVAGSSDLFTVEYFNLLKKHLKEGGIAVQWVPLVRMSNNDFKIAIKTFRSVFPHTQLWTSIKDSASIYLIGSDEKIIINQDRIDKAFEDGRIRANFEIFDIIDSEILLERFWFEDAEIDEYVKDVNVLNTDDFPTLEYSTPKFIDKNTALENAASLEEFRQRVSGWRMDKQNQTSIS